MNVGKWSWIILILIAALVASVAMLDAMGVIDFGGWVMALLERHPAIEAHAAIYRMGLDVDRALEEGYQQLAQREAELEAERALLEEEKRALAQEWAALERERTLLDQRARQLQALQESLDARAQRLNDFERLQVLYNRMRPDELVPIFEELEDGTVARLLAGMDDRKVAQVLAAMEPQRAAALSRLIGGVSSK